MTALTFAVFGLTYLLIATRRLSLLPIGRPAGALLGALLMVATGALSPDQAFAAVDANTLLLLFAMMALSAYLERYGLFNVVTSWALARLGTPRNLLIAMAWVPGLIAALLVNDAVCLFLTPPLVALAVRANLPLGPYLIALATSANLGSAATLVGNPQNMLIGSLSGLSFATFLMRAGPAALLALAINAWLLLRYYGRHLPAFFPASVEDDREAMKVDKIALGVVAGLLVCFLSGLHLGFSALGAVMVFVLLDRTEPNETFARIDWSVILFFSCLFVVVRGLASTGVVDSLWQGAAPHLSLETPGGIAALTALLALGSNIVSNVPIVLLTGSYLAELGDPERAWVLLAFVTTVAGNLTLVGSVANLIVAEQAKGHYELGFVEYLRFGLVSTVLVLCAGVPLVCWLT